jgi:hypothetical protein
MQREMIERMEDDLMLLGYQSWAEPPERTSVHRNIHKACRDKGISRSTASCLIST